MNLHENIHRVKQMMGIINEDDKAAKVHKLIDDMGLITTIKLFGGYENIINMYGDGIITRDIKIKTIQLLVGEIINEMNDTRFSVSDIGELPIWCGQPDDSVKQIEFFYPDFVSIDVYTGYKYVKYVKSFTQKYDELSDDTLDEVFEIIVSKKL